MAQLLLICIFGTIRIKPDKAKPQVIVGRKATDPRFLREPGCGIRKKEPDCCGSNRIGHPVFNLERKVGWVKRDGRRKKTFKKDHDICCNI
jgi:hypothetical protein